MGFVWLAGMILEARVGSWNDGGGSGGGGG